MLATDQLLLVVGSTLRQRRRSLPPIQQLEAILDNTVHDRYRQTKSSWSLLFRAILYLCLASVTLCVIIVAWFLLNWFAIICSVTLHTPSALISPIDPALSSSVCQALQQQIKGTVICSTLHHPHISDSSFFQPQCNDIQPGWIVRPKDAHDVATSVRVATAHNIKLSYRSGGHSFICKSVTAGSLHIDLRSMKKKALWQDDVNGDWYLTTEAGNTFADLFEIVDRKRFSFVHGECESVGVGGYYLHGGAHLGGLSKLYDWGNESIVNMEAVTADGSVLHLDPHQNSDLFSAMRAAGSSFGIMTSLTIRVHERPEPFVWEFWVLESSRESLLDVFLQHVSDPAIQLNIWPYNYKTPHLVIQISLLRGSERQWENLMQTLDWLKERSINLHPFWWLMWFNFHLWGWGQHTRTDYGKLYAWWTPFTHSGGTFPAHAITRYPASESPADVQMSISHLIDQSRSELCIYTINGIILNNNSLVAFDKTCFGDGVIAHLDIAPAPIKYYNIPTRGDNPCVYWPDWQRLSAVKQKWDPANVFDVYQGIKPDMQC